MGRINEFQTLNCAQQLVGRPTNIVGIGKLLLSWQRGRSQYIRQTSTLGEEPRSRRCCQATNVDSMKISITLLNLRIVCVLRSRDYALTSAAQSARRHAIFCVS